MKKLLIIDDEFIFRQGLRYMMDWEACGYTIIGEAINGQEGLALCKTLKPDLILCDVVMPVLNGVEFVREIHAVSGPPVIMLSNFDEYDKVRKAFQYGAADYILKSQVTKEMLLACLERIGAAQEHPDCREREKTFGVLIRQVLDGYAAEPYPELSSYLSHRMPVLAYRCLFLDSPQPDFQDESHLQEWIRQLLPSLYVSAAYTTQHHAICLIGLTDTGQTGWIPGFLHALREHIRHTSCVLSNSFEHLCIIRQKAERLYELCKYSILYEEKLVFTEWEIDQESVTTESFLSDRYFSYVRSGRLEQACSCLLSYLDTFKNKSAVNPYQLHKFLEHTFYASLRELRKTAEDPQQLNRIELKLFKQLDSAISYCQIRDALAGAFGELACVHTGLRQDDTVTAAMAAYLEENYSRQITLYDVAEHLHMNYSYLSAYISQNTGKHFSEHLNDTRIRHAKTMLSETDYSISYISESIGYADQSYFGKIFKKYVGITPLKYRNHALGK